MEKKEHSKIILPVYSRVSAHIRNSGICEHRRMALHIHIGQASPDFALRIAKTLESDKLLLFFFKTAPGVNIEELYNKSNSEEKIIFAPLEYSAATIELLTMVLTLLKLEQHQINITMEPELSETDKLTISQLGKHMNLLLSNNTCAARNTILHSRCAINNLPAIIKNGTCRFEKTLHSSDVLICGAGPSLKTQLDVIKKYSGKLIIIAAGHAFPCLAEAGIKPDFIVEIDAESHITWQRHSYKPTCPLVTVPFVSPKVSLLFDKILWFSARNSPLNALLKELGIELEPVAVSRSVIVTAIDFAVKSGAERIALAGNDLCLSSDGSAHASRSVLDNKSSEGLLEIKGNDSEKVLTTAGFNGIREILQSYLAEIKKSNHSVSIFNSTEGGAFIEHTQRLPLEDFCNSIKTEKHISFSSPNQHTGTEDKIKNLHRIVEKYIDIANSIIETVSLLENELDNTSGDIDRFKKIQSELQGLLTLESNFRNNAQFSFIINAMLEQTDIILRQIPHKTENAEFESAHNIRAHFSLLSDILKDIKSDLDFSEEKIAAHDFSVFQSFRNFAINFISRSDNEFADFLKSGIETQSGKFEVISNLQYLPNVRRILDNGQRAELNDFDSMESAAAQEIDAFVKAEEYSENSAVIFFAPGNWSHVVEFSKKYPFAEIMVVETWPELLNKIISISMFMNYLPEKTIITGIAPELKSWKRIAHSALRNWKKQNRKILFFRHPHTWQFADVQEQLRQFNEL